MAAPRRPADTSETNARGARFLIVEARFYDVIGAMLLEGAAAALAKAGASHHLVGVPGALEIPIAMEIALDRAQNEGKPYAGAIALGCVIRGETYHFEIVSSESARALMQLGVARRLALGNGVLTVDTEAQALARADFNKGDKGGDAARAALALYTLKQEIGALP
jgi:6,7-dimethyl-8-ribityllumazine synthase